jgi:DOMON domain
MSNNKSYKLRQQIMPANSVISFYQIVIVSVLLLINSTVETIGINWDHSIDLDENFRLMWMIRDQDITFEVQVRTQGYVGLGFSKDGTIYGADMAVGWIDHGHAYFQVSVCQVHGIPEWALSRVCLGVPNIKKR